MFLSLKLKSSTMFFKKKIRFQRGNRNLNLLITKRINQFYSYSLSIKFPNLISYSFLHLYFQFVNWDIFFKKSGHQIRFFPFGLTKIY